MITLQKKEPSKKRKFKNFIARCLVIVPEERGDKVWERLNSVLPEPIGSHYEDQDRIVEFKKLITKLSFLDYYSLKTWLKFRYKETEDMLFDLITGRQESYCTKWMQIYSEHYNVME